MQWVRLLSSSGVTGLPVPVVLRLCGRRAPSPAWAQTLSHRPVHHTPHSWEARHRSGAPARLGSLRVSRAALGAPDCSLETPGIEVLLRVAGPGVPGPGLEDCAEGRRTPAQPGDMKQLLKVHGGSFRESLHAGSRMQLPGSLQMPRDHTLQALGRGASALGPRQGSFVSCSAF